MGRWQFWIDRGGTFTDVVARAPDGRIHTHKLLSENPEHYRDAATAGIRAVLGLAANAPITPDLVSEVRLGTTVATNALLERKGAKVLLLVDAGYADLLRIGHQTRPDLFALEIRLPDPLYADVLEVGGRVGADGAALAPLDEAALLAALKARREAGLETCAVALIHAWQFPEAEARIAALAREAGFAHVSASHEVSPLLGLVARARTTVVDAYLAPVLRNYVAQVSAELQGVPLSFMQSNGGLAAADRFRAKDAILSGPAGGIVGAAKSAEEAGEPRVIAFDMGGTSTDVALYAGAFERQFDTKIAGVELRVPMLAIDTVAAGGGSILSFDGARLRAGPESAGANPGPAAYRRGGPLTVTDANVLCGKIQPRHFPAVFGPQGDQPLDAEVVARKFTEMAAPLGRDPRDLAEGFLTIAVATMAAAIKRTALSRGEDVASFTLQCFGGAGGQHACRVAEELGMRRVLIDPLAGVLSAYGIGLSERSALKQAAVELPLVADLTPKLEALEAEARHGLSGQVTAQASARLRYAGTDAALSVPLGEPQAMRAEFEEAHHRRFGFTTPEREVIVAELALEAVERSAPPKRPALPSGSGAASIDTVPLWTGAREWQAPVFDRDALGQGDTIPGPALIREAIGTVVIEPGWRGEVLANGALLLTHVEAAPAALPDLSQPDPVLLELFNQLFMGLAEQMGAVLEATSSSVNIRERLDFSCALFDAHGNLVANAPHLPVHLGSMGEAVRTVIASHGASLKPGDAVVLNNPYNGGTHLPDVTVVSPVFDEDGELRAFVANRGHHADIGGRTPGSMPPDSVRLEEEGVVIDPMLLASGGRFLEADFRAVLASGPFPARNPDMNVADIKAQLAANATGQREVAGLAARWGWPCVLAYMGHVMDNAEESVRRVIDRLHDGRFTLPMDQGGSIEVAVTLDHAARSARIDFTGTSPEREGNFNAPPAVTRAAVLYAFRCLTGDALPLNEGCLRPLEIVIPAGSFLSPAIGRAVVAGNTEVSQAITNAVFGALGALCAGQGTMNNFLFGNARHQYYETICGGAGAGPGFTGAGPVHTHMTNTRITDPEVLELRLPVRLEEFSVRRGSGGAGQWPGGEGVLRRLRFLEDMTVTLVASSRTVAPFGLAGGGDGACGRQWIERAEGRVESFGGTDEAQVGAGDAVVIETPGGGGYGAPFIGG
ncbi:hydantoinase B/oxoprolinase family protein [Novosphingobium sp. MW5]|nr:hydantoinase B/oxoprolinase family protein [Novosphingobium sp. MW5]